MFYASSLRVEFPASKCAGSKELCLLMPLWSAHLLCGYWSSCEVSKLVEAEKSLQVG